MGGCVEGGEKGCGTGSGREWECRRGEEKESDLGFAVQGGVVVRTVVCRVESRVEYRQIDSVGMWW